MAVFDHQDIFDLIKAGELDEAEQIYLLRLSKKGVSKHDQGTLDAAFAEAEVADLAVWDSLTADSPQ